MSVIALVEPHWWGHHPTYTKIVADVLLEQGHDLLCVCGDPADVAAHLRSSGREGRLDRTRFFPLRIQDVARDWRRYLLHAPEHRHGRLWSQTARAIRHLEKAAGKRVDLVLFMTLDPYLNIHLTGTSIDRLFPFPWAGLVLFPAWLHGSPGPPPPPLGSAHCRGLFLLDETLTNTAALLTGKPVWDFPDLTDISTPPPGRPTPMSGEIEMFRAGRPLIGLVGTTDRRKGIFELLEIARLPAASDLRFLVCGDVSTSAQSRELALFESQLRAARLPHFLHIRGPIRDGTDFNGLLAGLSLLWTAYANFPYSSNLLTKAAFFRLPVAANVGGLIARRVTDYDLGVVLPTHDPVRCLELIRRFLDGRHHWQPRCQEYYHHHSVERARERVELLQSLVGA